jgi:phosphohistidine swiveling domain-containing protein
VEGHSAYDREHYRSRLGDQVVDFPHDPVECSEDAAKLGRLIGRLGALRLWNRFHFMRVRYLMQQAIDSIVQRSGIPELHFATIEELQRWCSGLFVDVDKIGARSQGYAAVLVHGAAELHTGNDRETIAAQIHNSLVEAAAHHDARAATTQLRGDGAGSGTAVGRVRVIDFVADDYETAVARFEPGEVLVTGMTRPQIAHLCDRAAAIITDEGGITCHAAVISRERGIPAVVATMSATKVLTTGDLVQVHGDSGIVTVLDRAVSV